MTKKNIRNEWIPPACRFCIDYEEITSPSDHILPWAIVCRDSPKGTPLRAFIETPEDLCEIAEKHYHDLGGA